jgi:hypothetical protein
VYTKGTRAIKAAGKRRGVLLALLALPVLVGVAAAQVPPSAWAADGLPPGVPMPSWAKGKRVHFDPAEPQNPRLAGGDRVTSNAGMVASSAEASSAALSAAVRPLASSSSRLRYHGGTVQSEPHLMLVFLGEEWESGADLAERRDLEATAKDLTGSAWEAIMTQYSGWYGPISQPLAGSPVIETYDLKRPITTRIDSYAARQAGAEAINATEGWNRTDTTYMVLPAPGTVEAEARTCGFHEEYGTSEAGPSIAVVMDPEERLGCDTTKTLTHEYAESVTDPNGVSGWNTGEGVGGDEIADICNELGGGRLADGAQVAYLWDDSKDACEIEDADPGSPLPIGPYAETSYRLEGATNLTPESEKIETSIYPCDREAHYYFEYGTSVGYGTKTSEAAVPATWGAVKVSATLTGLQHSKPYHWRVVVKTSNGTADGVDHEFTISYYAEVKGERVSDVGLTEATLHGEVRPVGVQTKYYFEYGPTTAYGSRTAETSAGSGDEFVEVSAPLTGLTFGTTYHYRLVATNSRGTTAGEDQSFETHGGKPVVETTRALSIGYTQAELNAEVDAKGVSTTFYFEYGTTEAYGQQTPQRVWENNDLEEAGATIFELEPNKTYHFRIVATNSYGTSFGADESFSTAQEPFVETGTPTAVGYDDATLDGTIDPHGIKTGYYFEYGTSQTYGARTAEVTAGSGTSDVPAAQTVGFLAEHTTYHFRVVATTKYGSTHGADQTFSTGTAPLVQTAVATDLGSTGATLNGTIDPHGTKVEYYFEYGPAYASAYGFTTTLSSAGSGEGDIEASQTIAELSPGVTYHYRLVAVDDGAKQYGSEITFTTIAPPPPVEIISPMPPTAPLVPPVIAVGPTPNEMPAPTVPLVQNARQSTARWREDNRLARISRATTPTAPTGTTFSFSLNEQADVNFSFIQLGYNGQGCLASRHGIQKRESCNRKLVKGALSFTGHVGTNSVVFAGRISRRDRLNPGTYELIISATNAAGQHSAPAHLRFTITNK